jgi:hypothetical protein
VLTRKDQNNLGQLLTHSNPTYQSPGSALKTIHEAAICGDLISGKENELSSLPSNIADVDTLHHPSPSPIQSAIM